MKRASSESDLDSSSSASSASSDYSDDDSSSNKRLRISNKLVLDILGVSQRSQYNQTVLRRLTTCLNVPMTSFAGVSSDSKSASDLYMFTTNLEVDGGRKRPVELFMKVFAMDPYDTSLLRESVLYKYLFSLYADGYTRNVPIWIASAKECSVDNMVQFIQVPNARARFLASMNRLNEGLGRLAIDDPYYDNSSDSDDDTNTSFGYMVTVRMKGPTLWDYIDNPDNDIRQIIFQLMYTAFVMNELGYIAHNDLHLNNVIVDEPLAGETIPCTYRFFGQDYVMHSKRIPRIFDLDHSLSSSVRINKDLRRNKVQHDYEVSTFNGRRNDVWFIISQLKREVFPTDTALQTEIGDWPSNPNRDMCITLIKQLGEPLLGKATGTEFKYPKIQSRQKAYNISNAQDYTEGNVDLSDKNLTEVPTNVFSLKDIIGLDLSYNKLLSVPPQISRLASTVKALDLTNNRLTSLPESIGKMFRLHTLVVDDNQLTRLPRSIVDLNNLTILSVQNNRLTQLPSDINKLYSLRRLNVSGNKIKRLPYLRPNVTVLSSGNPCCSDSGSSADESE